MLAGLIRSELIKWAQTLEDSAVLQMITTLGDLEVRTNALSKEYLAKYKEFCEVFKQILFEKEELNGTRPRTRCTTEHCSHEAQVEKIKESC